MYQMTCGEGKHQVSLSALCSGNDLIVVISGGDSPHVGSVAVAVPGPSRRDAHKTSSTASVMTLVGHKDDELAKPVSQFIASELNQVCVVIVGIHVEQAIARDIETVSEAAWDLSRSFVRYMKDR